MKEIIGRYRKLIWIWIVFNLVALSVNVFGIQGHIRPRANLLTSKYTFGEYDDTGLWPFVRLWGTYSPQLRPGDRYSEFQLFNGIFYQYGLADFILYMIVLIGFLTYKAYVIQQKK